MVVVATITVTFIIIGDINKLAPIVTMPFLITYASIDYSYFALAQTFDLQHKREMRYATAYFLYDFCLPTCFFHLIYDSNLVILHKYLLSVFFQTQYLHLVSLTW